MLLSTPHAARPGSGVHWCQLTAIIHLRNMLPSKQKESRPQHFIDGDLQDHFLGMHGYAARLANLKGELVRHNGELVRPTKKADNRYSAWIKTGMGEQELVLPSHFFRVIIDPDHIATQVPNTVGSSLWPHRSLLYGLVGLMIALVLGDINSMLPLWQSFARIPNLKNPYRYAEPGPADLAFHQITAHLTHVQSKFQTIDVYRDEFFGNILVIDGDLQLTDHDEASYHEMLAHIPLNYIPNAKRALVVGGGDGGAAREVLRHRNIEHVSLVDIDKLVVDVCQQYFPSLARAYNDPRMAFFPTDAVAWTQQAAQVGKKFDVVLVDATDFGAGGPLHSAQFYSVSCPPPHDRHLF
jgi:hypothetical protein